ncbi:dtdp-4-dehydrorhamnose reductase [Leptolyngbya sp. Heron Island J]|uniref:dTDP-4-dehydrorhamnose reductase n=1 Tax=Leptolyngbya sp. Heron Island J TaxID=1385935 RepID=UPI0003B9DB32|nr:dTDP-4-dehydrorhamnose reductase [Leptolyngbya sp. Heron Island J]ESA33014.1 dtdp-4-dehydrorhamnose reductase [Leptolyngbya sp. Heron Island J]
MKILLLGCQGQVGQELQLTLPSLGAVVAWDRTHLDLTNLESIVPAVVNQQPDVIVNAAAYTAVDKAESEPDLAHQINTAAPEKLAQAATVCGASLVHISTDYVFDGQQNRPYQPEAETNPLGVYGHSKRDGELAIQANTEQAVIFRTAWVYGAKGKSNFVKTMLRLGAERDELGVVYDQVGTPTWAYDIAQAITMLIPHLQNNFGVYHYTNNGAASWYDFAVAIFEEARKLGHPLQLSHVQPIPSEQYPTPTPRPAYSVLAGDKIAKVINQTAPHWRASLRKMLKEYL